MPALDLDGIPAVDHHCHPFPAAAAVADPDELASHFIFAGVAVMNLVDPILSEPEIAAARRQLLETSLTHDIATRELSARLDCAPTWEAITARRNGLATADLRGYVGGLLDDATISTLIIEDGPADPWISPEAFGAYTPVKLARVARLENCIRALVADPGLPFPELTRRYDAWLEAEAAKGAVGFKSLIAYRTGLDVAIVDEAEAGRAWDAWRSRPGADLLDLKPVRDHLLIRAAEYAAETGRWIHIHTGLGDADIVYDRSQPRHLFRFLKHPRVQRTKVVLIHAGYPWVIDACSLAAVLPAVHVDLSSMTLFSMGNLVPYLRQALEVMPVSKLVYGSDGGMPETYWLAARVTRRALGRALGDLVDEGMLDRGRAVAFAHLVLHENAERMYGL